MQIRQMQLEDKDVVVDLLQEFRNVCHEIVFPDPTMRKILKPPVDGNSVFEYMLASTLHTWFVAVDDDELVGILTINITPQLRKWSYVADIEEMYVKQPYRWTWCSAQLMDEACLRLHTNHPLVKQLRLSSGNELQRAHAFYEKYWFKAEAKTFYFDIK